MSTELVQQVRTSSYLSPNTTAIPIGRQITPKGLVDVGTTIQSMTRIDCCDVVPQEKQPNCWQKLSPCQKKLVCCGGAVGIGGATGGILYGTGAFTALGSLGSVGTAILVCCLIKGVIIAAVCCGKKCCSEENN